MFYVYAPDLKFSKLPIYFQDMIRAQQCGEKKPNFLMYRDDRFKTANRYILVTDKSPMPQWSKKHWTPVFTSESFGEADCVASVYPRNEQSGDFPIAKPEETAQTSLS